jgi:hypothetical protein
LPTPDIPSNVMRLPSHSRKAPGDIFIFGLPDWPA